MEDDFDKFSNRIDIFDEQLDRLYSQTLPVLKDDKWREMRGSMNPFFAIKSIKEMNQLMMESVDTTLGYLIDTITHKAAAYESKHIFARYTVNVIASCCLGLEIDSNDHSKVCEIALKLANCFGFRGKLKILLMTFLPKAYRALGLQLVDAQTRNFFNKIIIEKMKFRQEEKIVRKDMLQFMLEAKQNDKIKSSLCWSEDALIAQSLACVGAGFETTTNLIQMTCYELAKNAEVQLELVNEINKINLCLGRERISFEALNKFKLLDCVVKESLRLWPPAFVIDRMCNKDCTLYTQREVAHEFKNRDQIVIPVYEIHHNSEYFKNPMKFDPHRFYEDDLIPGSYIPYGIGNRSCPGRNFSLLVVKLLLFHILSNFRIELCDKTQAEVEYEQRLNFIKVKNHRKKCTPTN